VSRSIHLLLLGFLAVVAACAHPVKVEPPSREHPANPEAAEAPGAPPPAALTPDDQDGPRVPGTGSASSPGRVIEATP
jgi:hypothetical protein